MIYRTDFTAEAHLAGKADIGRQGEIEIGRQNGADYSQVAGRVGDPHSPGDIEEHVLHVELEAGPFLQDSEKHVQSPDIETGG